MIDETFLNILFKTNKQKISNILQSTPQRVLSIVTQGDADMGYIMRYFIRPANDKSFITEIDKKQYERFKENPRFTITEIKWKIVGKLETITYNTGANLYGVKDQNRIAVANADLTFGGLRNYITNYGELWLRE